MSTTAASTSASPGTSDRAPSRLLHLPTSILAHITHLCPTISRQNLRATCQALRSLTDTTRVCLACEDALVPIRGTYGRPPRLPPDCAAERESTVTTVASLMRHRWSQLRSARIPWNLAILTSLMHHCRHLHTLSLCGFGRLTAADVPDLGMLSHCVSLRELKITSGMDGLCRKGFRTLGRLTHLRRLHVDLEWEDACKLCTSDVALVLCCLTHLMALHLCLDGIVDDGWHIRRTGDSWLDVATNHEMAVLSFEGHRLAAATRQQLGVYAPGALWPGSAINDQWLIAALNNVPSATDSGRPANDELPVSRRDDGHPEVGTGDKSPVTSTVSGGPAMATDGEQPPSGTDGQPGIATDHRSSAVEIRNRRLTKVINRSLSSLRSLVWNVCGTIGCPPILSSCTGLTEITSNTFQDQRSFMEFHLMPPSLYHLLPSFELLARLTIVQDASWVDDDMSQLQRCCQLTYLSVSTLMLSTNCSANLAALQHLHVQRMLYDRPLVGVLPGLQVLELVEDVAGRYSVFLQDLPLSTLRMPVTLLDKPGSSMAVLCSIEALTSLTVDVTGSLWSSPRGFEPTLLLQVRCLSIVGRLGGVTGPLLRLLGCIPDVHTLHLMCSFDTADALLSVVDEMQGFSQLDILELGPLALRAFQDGGCCMLPETEHYLHHMLSGLAQIQSLKVVRFLDSAEMAAESSAFVCEAKEKLPCMHPAAEWNWQPRKLLHQRVLEAIQVAQPLGFEVVWKEY